MHTTDRNVNNLTVGNVRNAPPHTLTPVRHSHTLCMRCSASPPASTHTPTSMRTAATLCMRHSAPPSWPPSMLKSAPPPTPPSASTMEGVTRFLSRNVQGTRLKSLLRNVQRFPRSRVAVFQVRNAAKHAIKCLCTNQKQNVPKCQ